MNTSGPILILSKINGPDVQTYSPDLICWPLSVVIRWRKCIHCINSIAVISAVQIYLDFM
jgi:hypothetical protein